MYEDFKVALTLTAITEYIIKQIINILNVMVFTATDLFFNLTFPFVRIILFELNLQRRRTC